MSKPRNIAAKATGKVTQKVDVEAKFNEAVEGMKIICNAQIRNVDRIDNLVNTYSALGEWNIIDHDGDQDASIGVAHAAIDEEKKNYETVLDVLDGLSFEDFKDKDMPDPIAPFIPDRHGITSIKDMYDAYVVFKCLRPYGEKIEQLHSMVVEAMDSQE